jgi:hypothetical protein
MAGSAPAATSAAPAHASARRGFVRLRIVVPERHRVRGRSSRYISPATKSIEINVFNAAHAKVATVARSLTPGSPGCTPPGGQPTTCTIQIALAPASYTANVTTFDGDGAELSRATGFPFTVDRGSANDVSMTLDGVPATVQVLPAPSAVFLGGTQALGFQLAGLAPQTVDVFARDVDGNVILGSGAPAVSLASNSSALVVTPAGNANPNQFVLTRTAASAAAIVLTATATPPGGGLVASVRPSLQFVPLLYMYQTGGIGEYAPWSNLPVRTITAGLSGTMTFSTQLQQNQILALDAAGFLYVIDAPNNDVVVYAPGATTPARTISNGISAPQALAFDPSGNLYVANSANVNVYESKSTDPSLTITNGISSPFALAFNAAGHLFVENLAATSVTEYNLTQSQSPIRTVTSGIFVPFGIAVDGSGNLYVGNIGNSGSNSTVEIYASNVTSPTNSLIIGPSQLLTSHFDGGLAVDPAGDVCVAKQAEVICGSILEGGFTDDIFGFPLVGSNTFAPAMAFDSTGALYILNEQPWNTMARVYAPFSEGFITNPTPTSVIAGSTGVFGLAVQD